MKLWHFAALVAVLGIAYVLIKRPSVRNLPVSTTASNSNSILSLGTSLVNLGSSIFTSNKASAPSAVPPDAGATADWNSVSSSELDQLRAGDAAQGVEGPF